MSAWMNSSRRAARGDGRRGRSYWAREVEASGPITTIAGFAERFRRSLAVLSAITLVAGVTTLFVPPVGVATADGGAYNLSWSAADPLDYDPKLPAQQPCVAPSGGAGRAADPMSGATYGDPKQSVQSLAPGSLALGQVLAFEMLVDVNGSTAPENGVISFRTAFGTHTGANVNNEFGFDPAYLVYCAFVDTADSATSDPGGDAKVDAFSSVITGAGATEAIEGTFKVSGLDDNDSVVVEIWVVLQDTVPDKVSGNVATEVIDAQTATPTATINAGAQNVPLMRVAEFLTVDADLSVAKSDTPDPVLAGGNLIYSLVVTNHSTDTVANTVVVTDTLDPSTSFVSGSWSGGTCTAVGDVVTCELGALSPLEVVTITISTTVDAAAPNAGTVQTGPCTVGAAGVDLCNLVSVDALTDDPDATDNSDSEPTNVQAAQIDVTKTSTTTSITAAGQSVPYSFSVTTGTGNAPLTGVTVTDPMCSAAPTRTSGDTNADSKLQPTETWTYTCSHTVAQAEMDDPDGNLDNTVTADSTQTAPVTDDLAIPLSRDAKIAVAKTSTTTSITAAGQSVPYSFAVTNPGNQSLTGVTVTDPMCTSAINAPTGDTNADSKLQPTETWTYTCSHTVTQAEMDDPDGNLDNTVTADSTQTAPVTDDLAIPLAQNQLMTFSKTVPETSYGKAGDVLHYTYVVTNTGNVTLTDLTVTDPQADAALSCTPASGSDLAPAAVMTCTATHAVDADDVAAGSVMNVATAASGQYSLQDSATVPFAQLSIDKSGVLVTDVVAPDGRADVGDRIDYTFEVSNDTVVPLTSITVVDPICDAAPAYVSGDDGDQELEQGETWTYTCSSLLTLADIDAGGVSNTATADSDESEPDTDSIRTPVEREPALSVEKSSDTAEITAAGQEVGYDLEVTNTGNQTLTGITVVDATCDAAPAYLSGDTNSDGKLQPHETWLYECTRTVTQAEMDAGGDLTNLATADSDQTGPTDDDLRIPIEQNPVIQVEKTSTTTAVAAAGQEVSYRLAVTNEGNQTVSGVEVDDASCDAAPQYVSGDLNSDDLLQLTETWVYECTRTVTQAEMDAGGDLSNTATADSEESEPDTDTLDIPIAQAAEIALVKSTVTTSVTAAGQSVPYVLTVTNPGNVTLTDVTVVDPSCTADPEYVSGDLNEDGGLQLAETWVYTCTRTVSQAEVDTGGELSNTATADSAESGPATDTVAVPVAQAKALELTKVPSPTTYSAVGAEIDYTYVVTNGGNVTLVGPFTVADDKTSTSCPQTASLAPDVSITCTSTYAITQADLDNGSVTNKATASGDGVDSNEATATVNAARNPVFALEKTADPVSGTIVQPGDEVTYTLTYTNTGNVSLPDAVITDPLPDGAVFVSIADGGSYDADEAVASWSTGAVAPGDSVAVAWTVTVATGLPAGSEVVNVATVGEEPSNETTHPVASGDLTLVKSVDKSTVPVGGTLTYTLAVTATGTLDQTDVVVTDTVPAGATYVAGSAAPAAIASYDATSRTVSWDVGDLAAGATAGDLTFQVTVDVPVPATDGTPPIEEIRNVGSVESEQTPATPSNEVVTTTTDVLPEQLVPTPTPTPAPPPPGIVLPFTGTTFPLQPALLAGFLLIGTGLVLTTRRRREHRTG